MMNNDARNIWYLLAGVIFVAVIGGLLWLLRPLVVALTIALIVAYLLSPLVRKLTSRLGGKRTLAANIVYLSLMSVLFGPVAIVGALILDRWSSLQSELGEISAILTEQLVQPISIFGFDLFPDSLSTSLGVAWSNTLSTFTLGDDSLLTGITDNLLWSLVVFVSLYYFLKDGNLIMPGLLRMVPERFQAQATLLTAEIDQVWGVFLRVQLFIFAVLAILVASSTTLIIWLFQQGKLPLSPIGLLLLLVVVYIAIQQVDNLWLRPQLMGQALKLHPGVIFVSLIAGLALSGLFGALLSVPLIATVRVIVKFVQHSVNAKPTHQGEVLESNELLNPPASQIIIEIE